MRKIDNKSNICGKIIENKRLLKNLSREQLAEKLQLMGFNVDRSFIYRIEKQKSIIKDFELIAICKILDINIDEFKKILTCEWQVVLVKC